VNCFTLFLQVRRDIRPVLDGLRPQEAVMIRIIKTVLTVMFIVALFWPLLFRDNPASSEKRPDSASPTTSFVLTREYKPAWQKSECAQHIAKEIDRSRSWLSRQSYALPGSFCSEVCRN
jgi:hypothetical protein